MPDDMERSPLIPEWDDVPEDDDAEPDDADVDHAGEVDEYEERP